MGVADALERIIYLLDRSLAPAPKVRAFQRAAEIVAALEPDELRSLVAAGRLTELEGIGESTGRAITQAYRGEVPDYLVRLEETSVVPVGEGSAVRDALRGDCHCHTTWSDGSASVKKMAETARELGHEYLVITDHSPRLSVARGLTADRLRAQLDEIAVVNMELTPFRVLTGIEVDILPDGSLDQEPELLERVDLVVASAHHKLRMEAPAMTRRLVAAVANRHVDVLGHPTNRKVRGRPPSSFDADVVLAACARFDTAIELNCRPERDDPPGELVDLAIEWGTKVAIDTDAHAPGQLEWQAYGCDKAARHGVPVERIVNTWTADELVEWARSHPVR